MERRCQCGHSVNSHRRVFLDKLSGPPFLVTDYQECRTCECPLFVEKEAMYLARRRGGK